jgi:PBP1b-binding outer membrane lipoprotein LpoB
VSKTGNMQGAKYRIEGSISSIVKQTKDVKDVYYVFNLNLINNESGLLEWADEKEIRKTATR